MALTDIFLRRRPSLVRAILRIVGDPQTAEDLTQETCIRARRAQARAPILQVEAFLNQTARNLALDHLRRRRVRVDIAAASPADLSRVALDSPSHEDRIAGRQLCDRLTDTLRGLPLRVQTVVVLARLENWSIRRIAEHLGVSERTVFNDLKLAMAHCRDAFARGG